MTVAAAIFLWGGEEYHRALADPFRTDARRKRRGDLVSGVGALVLGGGLCLLGTPALALTSGLLHAAGPDCPQNGPAPHCAGRRRRVRQWQGPPGAR
jgi:hypothetical protein